MGQKVSVNIVKSDSKQLPQCVEESGGDVSIGNSKGDDEDSDDSEDSEDEDDEEEQECPCECCHDKCPCCVKLTFCCLAALSI